MTEECKKRRRQREGSFTLIETVLALAIVAFLIVEVAAVQGNAIVFADYGRNITQATWLARRVMSQVEYLWRSKPFKELVTATPVEVPITDILDSQQKPVYSYKLEVKEWKFPFVQMLEMALGGKGGGDDESKGKSDGAAGDSKKSAGGDSGMSQMVEQIVKQIFGDEPIFLIAHVDVSWAEGAQQNSTGMSYLLTNQAKLDDAIVQMKPVYDKLTKSTKPGANGKPPPAGPAAGAGNPNVPANPNDPTVAQPSPPPDGN